MKKFVRFSVFVLAMAGLAGSMGRMIGYAVRGGLAENSTLWLLLNVTLFGCWVAAGFVVWDVVFGRKRA